MKSLRLVLATLFTIAQSSLIQSILKKKRLEGRRIKSGTPQPPYLA